MISSLELRMAFQSITKATTTNGLQRAMSSLLSIDLSSFGLNNNNCCLAPRGQFGRCDFKYKFCETKVPAQQLTCFLGTKIEGTGYGCKTQVTGCFSKAPEEGDRGTEEADNCSNAGRSEACISSSVDSKDDGCFGAGSGTSASSSSSESASCEATDAGEASFGSDSPGSCGENGWGGKL